jgi:YHS domain-containing protein
MENIIWFLVIGALFYFMMRHGCGAHIGGHGGHGGGHGGSHEGHMGRGEGPTDLSPTSKDPVCGMEIEKGQAYAMASRDGRQFYFCSESCQNKFNGEPGKYL